MDRIPIRPAAVLVVVLESLLLFQVSMAAVTIGGFQSGCSGVAVACNNVPAGACCSFSNPSPSPFVIGLPPCGVVTFYHDPKCIRIGCSKCGPNFCNQEADCDRTQSGRWEKDPKKCKCSTTEQSSETGSVGSKVKGCTSTMLPNAVTYFPSTGSSKGAWVLETGSEKLQETVDQLEKLSTEQQEAWMKAAGATFSEATMDD